MSSEERCVIHIGAPKTGTTSLQAWLSGCPVEGVHYSTGLRIPEDPHGHHRLTEERSSWAGDAFRALQAQEQVVLFSCEGLFPIDEARSRSLEQFVGFCEDYRTVEVVVTLREPSMWMLRWVQQHMLQGHVLDSAAWGGDFSLEWAFQSLTRVVLSHDIKLSLFPYSSNVNRTLLAHMGASADDFLLDLNRTPRLDRGSWEFLSVIVRHASLQYRYETAMEIQDRLASADLHRDSISDWFRADDIERWQREMRNGLNILDGFGVATKEVEKCLTRDEQSWFGEATDYREIEPGTNMDSRGQVAHLADAYRDFRRQVGCPSS